MNFHPQFNKLITPQKNKASDASPMVKRIRLTSPSHSPPHRNTLIKSKDQRVSLTNEDPNSISDILHNEVSLVSYDIDILINRIRIIIPPLILSWKLNGPFNHDLVSVEINESRYLFFSLV